MTLRDWFFLLQGVFYTIVVLDVILIIVYVHLVRTRLKRRNRR